MVKCRYNLIDIFITLPLTIANIIKVTSQGSTHSTDTVDRDTNGNTINYGNVGKLNNNINDYFVWYLQRFFVDHKTY